MAAGQGARGNGNSSEFILHHQVQLMEIVVSVGVYAVADNCEEHELLGGNAKEKIVAKQTESEQASLLVNSVRHSFMQGNTEELNALCLDTFLCILYKGSPVSGKNAIKELTNKYDGHLPDVTALIANYKPPQFNFKAPNTMESSIDSIHIHSGEKLEVSSLCKALKDLIKWDKFADSLPRIRQPDIDRITLENKGDFEGQKRALFDTWLRRDVNSSWDTVLDALDSAGENRLADKIREKLWLTKRQSSVFSDQSFSSEDSLRRQSSSFSNNSFSSEVATPPPATPTQLLTMPSLPEKPDNTLDPKKLFKKQPSIEDVLEALPPETDCCEFRQQLGVEAKGQLKDAIYSWTMKEEKDVTWQTLLKALRDSSMKGHARKIINNYLKRPTVYKKYIARVDYNGDLGLD